MDAIHITNNDRPFDCPIIYTDTIYITGNDHSFICLIIYINHILEQYQLKRQSIFISYIGRAQLIQCHLSARISFKISGNMN